MLLQRYFFTFFVFLHRSPFCLPRLVRIGAIFTDDQKVKIFLLDFCHYYDLFTLYRILPQKWLSNTLCIKSTKTQQYSPTRPWHMIFSTCPGRTHSGPQTRWQRNFKGIFNWIFPRFATKSATAFRLCLDPMISFWALTSSPCVTPWTSPTWRPGSTSTTTTKSPRLICTRLKSWWIRLIRY